jgi:hypothetical protein
MSMHHRVMEMCTQTEQQHKGKDPCQVCNGKGESYVMMWYDRAINTDSWRRKVCARTEVVNVLLCSECIKVVRELDRVIYPSELEMLSILREAGAGGGVPRN